MSQMEKVCSAKAKLQLCVNDDNGLKLTVKLSDVFIQHAPLLVL